MAEFIRVASTAEIPEGRGRSFRVDGKEIAVFNAGGEFFAVSDICPHAGGPLGEGELDRGVVICPWHGWAFDVRTGKYAGSEQDGIDRFPLKIEGGAIFVCPEACASSSGAPHPETGA